MTGRSIRESTTEQHGFRGAMQSDDRWRGWTDAKYRQCSLTSYHHHRFALSHEMIYPALSPDIWDSVLDVVNNWQQVKRRNFVCPAWHTLLRLRLITIVSFDDFAKRPKWDEGTQAVENIRHIVRSAQLRRWHPFVLRRRPLRMREAGVNCPPDMHNIWSIVSHNMNSRKQPKV
jgi:hypothetical protein